MIAVGLDLETTGLDYKDGHRIIEIALCVRDMTTGATIKDLALRFNPRREISAKAYEVHGIKLSDLVAEPLFADKCAMIAGILNNAAVVVAHNGLGFDKPFIDYEMALSGVALRQDLVWFDTMLHGLWATQDGKRPTLRELAFSLGFEYDEEKAHGALYDTQLMMDCFFTARKRYRLFQLPNEEEIAAGGWAEKRAK
ncbi:3'-5' exonuclease [Xenorhabdus bovienii]|uniref:3'-5' exonuclease n=1 Tax=Xenorhabdus bovienii TaxID=40576 RepID=UPI0023B23AC1|nr:3'-5' exonuclease [Xenorhabdus bovienii]MDE9494394.1 3'-5' exonuclease [Xenorhabdus bovienii]MDE9502833.1 3'-5' exonuclease [Xenorhabdus bovienii]MDE9526448.1 3'-5' exonuclease [Xenorhabdus bovienii]